jgi:hypothetical protein
VCEDQQAAFYKDTANLNAAVSNERLIELTTKEEHGEFYEDAGEWLPLAAWAHRGFDADAIRDKSRPEDRKQHPVLGDTYRVAILKNGWRGSKTVGKTDKLAATTALPSSGSSGSGLVPMLGQPALLALGDKTESEDSDSSSSSSSRHKRSKKSKKSKKDKKDKKSKTDARKDSKKRKREQSSGAADPGEFKCLVEVTFAEVILLYQL